MSSKNDTSSHLRPIDAPDLPPWLGRSKAEPESEEDAETQNITDRPASSAVGDPRELARKLALEAKLRMAHAPVPQREPQERKEEPTMAAEDPRELARRLAEEAKKRLKAPSQEQTRLLDDLPPEDEPEPVVLPPERPAAERAAPSKPLSALEALAAAREAEKRAKTSAAPAPAQAPSAPPPVQRAPATPPRAEERAFERTVLLPEERPSERTVMLPTARPSLDSLPRILQRIFNPPGGPSGTVEVDSMVAVENAEVFRALWRAHGARALHEGDIQLVATASALSDAASRLPAGHLAAARVRIGPVTWAVWVDLDREALLGVARPAEIYLAGM